MRQAGGEGELAMVSRFVHVYDDPCGDSVPQSFGIK